jgi:integrase
MRRTINIAIKKPPSDTTIWPVEVFTQYARECQPPGKQEWPDLIGLAAAAFVTMVPCRPVALIRIDPTRVKTRNDGQALMVLAHEKTNFGRGLTSLTIRKVPEERLSPWFYFTLLARKSRRLRCPNALFCSNRGQHYARADVLGKALVRLLHRMGVHGYTRYSFRHSMIQKLFDAGLDGKQVNAYMGHSDQSHTALNYYYHLDKQWASAKIAAKPTDRVKLCDEALRIIGFIFIFILIYF